MHLPVEDVRNEPSRGVLEYELGRPTETVDQWLATGAVPGDIRPFPAVTLPKPSTTECEACGGRGTIHDCPECGCECRACAGMGMDVQRIIVRFGDVAIESLQFRLIHVLPNARISRRLTSFGHVYFEFDGGTGIAMHVRKIEPDDAVVDADQPAQAMGAAT